MPASAALPAAIAFAAVSASVKVWTAAHASTTSHGTLYVPVDRSSTVWVPPLHVPSASSLHAR